MGSRRYCFTRNNPDRNELDPFPDYVRYCIWQREKGEETGTEHLQGYVELKTPKRMSALVKWLPHTHFEVARGTRDQARDYCRKEDSRVAGPWEYGDWRAGGSGCRSDLVAVKELIDFGADEKAVAEEYFGTWCRNYKAFREYKRIRTGTGRDWTTEVEVFYGDPGTGKSRLAMEANPGAFWKPKGNWWDGYEAHEVVIIDEFYGWMPYDFVLRMCDRYPLNVEVKGGTVAFLAKKVVFTSNKHPDDWYSKEGLDKRAFARRVTKLVHFYGTNQEDKTVVYKQLHNVN